MGTCADDCDDDDASWHPQHRSKKKQRVEKKKQRVEASAVITGGKATKTGMVLARAQLSTAERRASWRRKSGSSSLLLEADFLHANGTLCYTDDGAILMTVW